LLGKDIHSVHFICPEYRQAFSEHLLEVARKKISATKRLKLENFRDVNH